MAEYFRCLIIRLPTNYDEKRRISNTSYSSLL